MDQRDVCGDYSCGPSSKLRARVSRPVTSSHTWNDFFPTTDRSRPSCFDLGIRVFRADEARRVPATVHGCPPLRAHGQPSRAPDAPGRLRISRTTSDIEHSGIFASARVLLLGARRCRLRCPGRAYRTRRRSLPAIDAPGGRHGNRCSTRFAAAVQSDGNSQLHGCRIPGPVRG
jgi:hypothetical protein